MDKLTHYRKAITEALEHYATIGYAHKERHPDAFDLQLLFDRDRDHYQLLGLGWNGNHQTCLVIFHFAIQHGKVWLHRNVANYDILEDIEARGVPKEDIVLAFQPPAIRQYTGYAVA